MIRSLSRRHVLSRYVRYAHTVDVIALQPTDDTKRLPLHQVSTVKAGFARNYLLPQKKAVYATPANRDKYLKDVKTITAELTDDEGRAAAVLRKYLSNKALKMWRTPVDDSGMSCRPVTPKMVREKLSQQLKIDLEDDEKITFPDDVERILQLGAFEANIHLKGDHLVPLRVNVVKR